MYIWSEASVNSLTTDKIIEDLNKIFFFGTKFSTVNAFVFQ